MQMHSLSFDVSHTLAGSLVLIVLILLTSFAIRWATGGFKQRGR